MPKDMPMDNTSLLAPLLTDMVNATLQSAFVKPIFEKRCLDVHVLRSMSHVSCCIEVSGTMYVENELRHCIGKNNVNDVDSTDRLGRSCVSTKI